MEKTITIVCATCGKETQKRATEIRRQKQKGKKYFYCDLKCAGKNNCSHLEKYIDEKSILRITKYQKTKDKYSQFRYHLNNAKKHTNSIHPLDIDIEYLKKIWEKQKGLCAVTGVSLKNKFIHTKKQKTEKHPYQASLDRIDNNKGYIKGNVRFVALIFNYARNTFDDKQVIEFCKQVVSNVS
jgi:hypothetical protein